MTYRSVLVTGGSSGLGRATALRLLNSGKFKVMVADIREEIEKYEKMLFHKTDVTNEDSVEEALEIVKTKFGDEVSVVINCAGIGFAQKILNKQMAPHDLDAFSNVIKINVLGTFNVMRLAAARMALRKPDADGQRGVIINTSSIAAFEGQKGQAAYAASKGAISALTLPSARDLSKYGIRVCAIAPGLFRTPLLEDLPPHVQEQLGASVPNPSRLGRPEEFASLVEWIIGNNMFNGEVVRLDGALRLPP